MRKQINGSTVKVWISARETYDWAHKSGASWPSSTLSDRRLFAEFDNGDLVDLVVNGKPDYDGETDAHEFNSLIADMLGSSLPIPAACPVCGASFILPDGSWSNDGGTACSTACFRRGVLNGKAAR